MTLVEIAHLRKTFGELVAVDDVSLSVDRGEIFGFLGPNGAGKTTTMMMLAGLVERDSGTIRLAGKELDYQDRQSRRGMGVVPQELAIYPSLTARENLRFYGRLYGLSGSDLKSQIDKVLERIGLTDRADDLTETHSGGMKRRLNFGCALLHRPQLLVLDEPTVGVDPQSRAHLLNCVRQLRDEGVAVIYCSHYMEEVQELCDRVAVIDRGKLLACDRLDTLLGRVSAKVRLRVSDVPSGCKAALGELEGVELRERNGECLVSMENGEREGRGDFLAALADVLRCVQDAGGRLQRLESDEPDLERLFLQMTGSRLRD
ncbi:MAG: ABC transporter ATP-binding protein [Planctomycetaceae bacterium]